MNKTSQHASADSALASLPDRFVDPVELCERILTAADGLHQVEVDGLYSDQLARAGQQRPLTMEEYEQFTALASRAKIVGRWSDSADGGEPVRYAIRFEFNPGEHETGQGGVVRKSTLLLRDGEPVLQSQAVVACESGFDNADDYNSRRESRTSLLHEDRLARAVLDLLRDEQTAQDLESSSLRVALCEAVRQPGVTYKLLDRETGINHRTLSRLARGENVQLHVSQIVALNDRLAERQSRFLMRHNLGDALAHCDDIRLLLPAYRDASDRHRRLCSPWDVLGADRIRTRLGETGRQRRSVLQKIAHEQPEHPVLQARPSKTSLICIGSPRALKLCDDVLVRLATFGQDELTLPFRFYWKGYESESPYVLGESEVEWSPWKDKLDGLRAAVLIDGEEPFREVSNLVDPTRNTFESFAVVAVRWLSADSLLGCLAGLTGPASEAAGRLFLDLDFSVPRPDPRKREAELASPLAWYLIAAKIGVDPSDAHTEPKDDLRFLIDDGVRVVSGPHYLAPGPSARPSAAARPYKAR